MILIWCIVGLLVLLGVLSIVLDVIVPMCARRWPCKSEGPSLHNTVDADGKRRCKDCPATWTMHKLYSVASGNTDDYMPIWTRD